MSVASFGRWGLDLNVVELCGAAMITNTHGLDIGRHDECTVDCHDHAC